MFVSECDASRVRCSSPTLCQRPQQAAVQILREAFSLSSITRHHHCEEELYSVSQSSNSKPRQLCRELPEFRVGNQNLRTALCSLAKTNSFREEEKLAKVDRAICWAKAWRVSVTLRSAVTYVMSRPCRSCSPLLSLPLARPARYLSWSITAYYFELLEMLSPLTCSPNWLITRTWHALRHIRHHH